MRAAPVRVVGHPDIARIHAGVVGDDALDGFSHGPQVHGNVRCIDDEVTGGRKDRTTEIEPLFHVDAAGCALERQAHPLGDGGKLVVEDFQEDGVGLHGVNGRQGRIVRWRTQVGQQQLTAGKNFQLPRRLHDHGRGALVDQRGSGQPVSCPKVASREHQRFTLFSSENATSVLTRYNLASADTCAIWAALRPSGRGLRSGRRQFQWRGPAERSHRAVGAG